MNLYICYRYDPDSKSPSWWRGVVIVVAADEEQAGVTVVNHERWGDTPLTGEAARDDYEWPKKIVQMADVTATGNPRILYDEPER